MNTKLPITTAIKSKHNRPTGDDFFLKKSAHLYLNDGTKFSGHVPSWQNGAYTGEVVFNTGMTGYVESLTDPSYTNQILVFTYPLIGNYGVQPNDTESGAIQVSGMIVSELAANGSHADSVSSLLEWLRSQNIPIMTVLDTRALTKYLRTRGTMVGSISLGPITTKKIKHVARRLPSIEPQTYNQKYTKKVVLVDCGAKDNILRSLLKLPVQVERVSLDYDYTTKPYDAVVLSNGPGDPTDYQKTIAIAAMALKKNKPVFGICLGSQIMALAAGAKTYKLLYGHRGHNQPCINLKDQRCYITSQNHGYAIDEKTLPKNWQVSFRNLNDQSVEGIRHKTKPFFSVQFHPEASPGPTDTAWLFNDFYKAV